LIAFAPVGLLVFEPVGLRVSSLAVFADGCLVACIRALIVVLSELSGFTFIILRDGPRIDGTPPPPDAAINPPSLSFVWRPSSSAPGATDVERPAARTSAASAQSTEAREAIASAAVK
jgi:hypothetical protein